MTRPLIGITTYDRDADNKFFLPANYVDAVRRASGAVVLLPHGEDLSNGLMRMLDGLVLPGGGDIDPAKYGGAPHEKLYRVDPERDGSELALARWAVRSGVPTLGICRGVQVINVALGGTLIEHLPDAVGESVLHRAPPREPTRHAVRLEAGCRLAVILTRPEFEAASWHHQAIRDVAEGLKVVGRAPDGTIEAVEMPGHPWLFGVQWHPELTAEHETLQQGLFDALVAAAFEFQRARSR